MVAEISVILGVYEGKHGEGSIPAVDTLCTCLEEIREDGTLKPDSRPNSQVSTKELSKTIRLLSETKIPLHELKAWARQTSEQTMDQLRMFRRLRLSDRTS